MGEYDGSFVGVRGDGVFSFCFFQLHNFLFPHVHAKDDISCRVICRSYLHTML